MASKTTVTVAMVLGSALFLAGCEETQMPGFLKKSEESSSKDSTKLFAKKKSGGERDVEAPEIFQMAEKGLWDGRPSLGGVWVAHPTAKDPERVIIRNQANGKSVVGALFRRERDIPGPRFQVSSDAAEELGMLAGAPAQLSVTALRKEEIQEEAEAPTAEFEAAEEIKEATLDDPIEAASAAIDKAEDKTTAEAASVAAAKPAAPKPAAAPKSSSLSKPFIQIGIFSVEQNAKNTSEALRQAGMVPTIKPGTSNGKNFWRVVVGPAGNSAERATLLKKIKGLGFADAYFVTN